MADLRLSVPDSGTDGQESSMNQEVSPSSPIVVTPKDLPLSCPTPEMELWNMHPRVYLPIRETGRAVCPYCGAEFVLEG